MTPRFLTYKPLRLEHMHLGLRYAEICDGGEFGEAKLRPQFLVGTSVLHDYVSNGLVGAVSLISRGRRFDTRRRSVECFSEYSLAKESTRSSRTVSDS